jgi:hypothetical protein
MPIERIPGIEFDPKAAIESRQRLTEAEGPFIKADSERDIFIRIGRVVQNEKRLEAHFDVDADLTAIIVNIRRVVAEINRGNIPVDFGPPGQVKSDLQHLQESMSLVGRFILQKPALSAEQRALFVMSMSGG